MDNLNFDRESHQDEWLPLISDYVDEIVLPAATKARLEQHLADCSQCSADLEGLKQMVAALQSLPILAVPRSFTITPAQARLLKPRPVYRFAQFAAAMAAAFLLFTLSLDLLGVFSVTPPPSQATTSVEQTPIQDLVGTLPPPNKTTGAVGGFGGVAGTPATIIPDPTAVPTVKPNGLAEASTTPIAIRYVEFGLLAMAILFASFALAVRPRAPDLLKA